MATVDSRQKVLMEGHLRHRPQSGIGISRVSHSSACGSSSALQCVLLYIFCVFSTFTEIELLVTAHTVHDLSWLVAAVALERARYMHVVCRQVTWYTCIMFCLRQSIHRITSCLLVCLRIRCVRRCNVKGKQ